MGDEINPGATEPAKTPDELVKPDRGAPLSIAELDQVSGGHAGDILIPIGGVSGGKDDVEPSRL